MAIEVTIRDGEYAAGEAYLGNGGHLGYVKAVFWANYFTREDQTALRDALAARLAALLTSDPECQRILSDAEGKRLEKRHV